MGWKSTNFRIASRFLPSFPPSPIRIPSLIIHFEFVSDRRRLLSDHVRRAVLHGERAASGKSGRSALKDSRLFTASGFEDGEEDKRTNGH